jgi:hypothetical protein
MVIGHCCDLFIYLFMSGNMAVSCDHHCVIEKLLQTPSSSFIYGDKLKIIEEGAPKPNLNLYTKIKTFTQHFNTSLCEAIPWFCGCDKLNKLSCWPCLLFSKEKHVFNSAGFNDINNIYKSEKIHRHSVNHIVCLKEIRLFGNNSRIEFPLSSQSANTNNELKHAMRQLNKTGKLS